MKSPRKKVWKKKRRRPRMEAGGNPTVMERSTEEDGWEAGVSGGSETGQREVPETVGSGKAGETFSRGKCHHGRGTLRWHRWRGKEKLTASGGTQPVPQQGVLSGGEAGRGSANHYFERCGWARRKENSPRGTPGHRGHPKLPSPDQFLPGAPDTHFKLQTSSLQWASCL